MSGNIAAILPLPSLANVASPTIAEKSFVNDLAVMFVAVVEEVLGGVVVVVVVVVELPQAATRSPVANASATPLIRLGFIRCLFPLSLGT